MRHGFLMPGVGRPGVGREPAKNVTNTDKRSLWNPLRRAGHGPGCSMS